MKTAPASPFLHAWSAALGRNGGVLLQSAATLDDLSAHLRKIFVVRDEQEQEYFFRYYDPRVLRVYLPTCTGAELDEFFGPVQRWLVEASAGDGFIELTHRAGQLTVRDLAAQ